MLAQENLSQPEHYYLSDDKPIILADIYDEPVQLINWQRQLSREIEQEIGQLISTRNTFTFRIILPPNEVANWLQQQWSDRQYPHLAKDVEMLATLYADLFEIAEIGLRLELVNKTLCPLFHVDKVPCRLVSTYTGRTTEWLTDDNTNRAALSERDHHHIAIDENALNRVSVGDVLLFKGQSWHDVEGDGVVHRSPEATPEQRRLILTLDMI